MTRADRIFVLVLVVLALVSWPLVATAGAAGERVTITGPHGTTEARLATDRVLLVEGRQGLVRVVIEDGTVRVASADCPDHTCVKTGAVSSAGAMVACVPNGVVLQVEGARGDELDARIR